MNWIFRYQLFLFDFDGLLVDTEKLHYQAYIKMCAERGFHLDWSFHRYSEAAHHQSSGLQDQIYAKFPELYLQEPNWKILYEEKKRILLSLIENEPIPLMPGVADLLLALQKANIKRCVVTHSPTILIQGIRKHNPILNTIPYWITREDYTHPKPDPESYQTAINRLANPQDHIIGFEDSPRGLNALLGTNAVPVLICPLDSNYLKDTLQENSNNKLSYYSSFTEINDENAPFTK